MKRLLILSGKGGTGKTTTTAAFIRFAQARAVADCDVDAPNLHLVTPRRSEPVVSDFFGGEKAAVDPEKCVGCGLCVERCRFRALQVADGVCQVNEYACEGCGVCAYVCPRGAVTLAPDRAGRRELYLEDGVFSTAALKMGRGNSGKLVTQVKLDLLKHAPETDLAILDGSPGIGCPVIASVSGMDLVLVVAEPSQSGLSDLKRLLTTAEALQARVAVCVNKWDVSPAHTQAIREFCTTEGVPFVGEVPYDRRASQAINEGKSLADVDCPARDALYSIFQAVCGLLGLQGGAPDASPLKSK